jgi:hypothetical protein
MHYRRSWDVLLPVFLLAVLALTPFGSTGRRAVATDPPAQTGLIAGRNVNMVSGTQLPAGDPFLQRQNEPSIAVSTRNPMHIVAGANDYRTVDMVIPSEEIPGYEGAAAARDAWLGLYFSFDGGQSWRSTLLPGFPQDYTNRGSSSPLKAYGTAADPVVRAGTSGLFYFAGLAFTRSQSDNAVFVARFIDNNNSESPSAYPVRYVDTQIVDKGNSGQFIDKPWLAVDVPRTGAKKATIKGDGVPSQSISAGHAYLAYSIFTGKSASNPNSRVYIARSTDCGTTWEKATKLSESSHLNQGVTIAVAPSTGNVYVAWRRFAHASDPDAIMVCYSTDAGKTYGKPILAATIAPFDQGTSGTSFRTNAYPAMTVDAAGTVYLAWAQRGIGPNNEARIVVSTSTNGAGWSAPQPLDNHSGVGHQIMPTLAYGAGMITAAWYDQRNDAAASGSYISGGNRILDVRAAQFAVATGARNAVQVSRYLTLLDRSGVSHQVRFNPPNLPLFKEGTRPFHGDYIDLTPVPMFVPTSGGGWTFNTDGTQSPVFHAAWTDNRNVKPPADGNWTHYAPPSSAQDAAFQSGMTCLPGQASMRNQDVYMASLTRGLIVGSPSNVKPLNRTSSKHTFVVFVKNTTKQTRWFRLTLAPATGVTASFKQFAALPTLEVEVARASSVSRTVYATGSAKFGSIKVNVVEISGENGSVVGDGLTGYTVLNPDIENPDIENPDIENAEVHNPDIENPDIENPDIENPDIENPDIENPDIENPDIINPDIENPDIENPDIENPDIENAGYMNPDIENPDIENPDIENSSISDYTWKVGNAGNTTSAFTFKMIIAGFEATNYPGFGFQLLIYRVHWVPTASSEPGACGLKQRHQDELIANIVNPILFNPDIENPDIENPDIENPDIENASFWLEPGDKAYVTLRVFDPNKNDNVKFDPAVTPIMGVAAAQAANTVDELANRQAPPVSSPVAALTILNDTLPAGKPNTAYATYLVAVGGKPHYAWTVAGALPAGLSLNPSTGAITGTPTASGVFPLTFTVADAASGTASKTLPLTVAAPCTVSRPSIPTGTATGAVNVPYAFATGGATDSQGHPLEYRLEWATDQHTAWSASASIPVTFAAIGTYSLRAQARCALSPAVVSSWSAAMTVTIYASVSTIQGVITYNANPVTNMSDARGKLAEIILSDEVSHQRFPSSPTYDSATGAYSVPNIPQGIYGFEIRIENPPPDGKHFPGEYDGITNNVAVPAGPATVVQELKVQKLLHLTSPVDNSVLQHWPGPVFDVHLSPVLMDWSDLTEAAYYQSRVVQKMSTSPYTQIWSGGDITSPVSQASFILPANGSDDNYEFTLNAYNGSGLLIGRLMMEFVGGYGWDYRFRISAPADTTPPQATGFSPANGGTGVAFDAPMRITFDESVAKGTGNILIKKIANDAVFQTIDAASGYVTVAANVVTISHDVLGASTGYYVQIAPTCFDDLVGNSYAGIGDKTTWTFATADVSGLQAYYPFNGNANDASGNGHDGIIHGATPVFESDRLGNPTGALVFNGVDNYIELPHENQFDLRNFTILAVFKLPDLSRRNGIIMKGMDYGNYTIEVNSGTDSFPGSIYYVQKVAGGNYSAPIYMQRVTPNTYFHIGMTMSNDPSPEFQAYVNGAPWYAVRSDFTPALQNDDPVHIGRLDFITLPSEYFKGTIDEIRIYNRPLTATEVRAIYSKDR